MWGQKHSRAFYALIAKRVPVDMIYEALSEARQEGKSKAKLYTKIIKDKAKKYLDKYLKRTTEDEEAIVISEVERKEIENELIKEKDEFEKRKRVLDPPFLTEEETRVENDYEWYRVILHRIRNKKATETDIKEKNRIESEYGEEMKEYAKKLEPELIREEREELNEEMIRIANQELLNEQNTV